MYLERSTSPKSILAEDWFLKSRAKDGIWAGLKGTGRAEPELIEVENCDDQPGNIGRPYKICLHLSDTKRARERERKKNIENGIQGQEDGINGEGESEMKG